MKAEPDTDEVYAQVTLVPHLQVWMLSLFGVWIYNCESLWNYWE